MFGGRFQFTIAFLVLIVVILLYVNGAIWWATHETGPFIMDIFDMGNLLLGFLFKGWSLGLDEHFGTHFFAPVTWWIVSVMKIMRKRALYTKYQQPLFSF